MVLRLPAGRLADGARRAAAFRACGRFAGLRAALREAAARLADFPAAGLRRDDAGFRARAADAFFPVLLRVRDAADFARVAVALFFFAAGFFFALDLLLAAADERFLGAAITPPLSEPNAETHSNAFPSAVEPGNATSERMQSC